MRSWPASLVFCLLTLPHDTSTITNTNTEDTTDCDLEEKQHASLLISQLEELTEQQTERTKVLLGLIDLQAVMDARLNQLFQADCSTLIGQDPSKYWALIG